jgi:hypothetical protein
VKHTKAIATLVVGDQYTQLWKDCCETNWQQYAVKHGYDVICLKGALDTSERAQKRSPSWQKCLILSQDFATQYERVVWMDSDIVINVAAAPDVAEGVPLEKIGVPDYWEQPVPHLYRECLRRMYGFWGEGAVVNYDPPQYYKNYGFDRAFDRVAGNGVMVLSPRHHRELLEHNYNAYEDRGPAWLAEMRPFSYELLKAGCDHWLDHRFNMNWWELRFLFYPFLLQQPLPSAYAARARRKLAQWAEGDCFERVKRACVNAMFLNGYFLHFGGDTKEDMRLLDSSITSWKQCTLAAC